CGLRIAVHTGEVQGSIPCAPTIKAHFDPAPKVQSAVRYGTKRELRNSTGGKSGEFVHRPFARLPTPLDRASMAHARPHPPAKRSPSQRCATLACSGF